MFKELDENLSSIEKEVSKLKTAVTHIEEAKEAATKAVKVADTTTKEFKEHLQKVTKAVDEILKPHQKLISATENLTETIKSIDFPNQLNFIKVIVIISALTTLIGIIVIYNNLP